MITNSEVSPALREMNTELAKEFKDTYIFDFLNLPELHSENDLQKGLNKCKILFLNWVETSYLSEKNIKCRSALQIFTLIYFFITGDCNV